MDLGSLLFHCMLICYFMYVNLVPPVNAAMLQNESDHMALMAFKDAITDDPFGVLSSWNHSYHFCDWVGISCSNRHQKRVVSLDLKNQKLGGVLSPDIGNLSFLRILNLTNNSFGGEIPPELSRLFRLEGLPLENNTFEGEIPTNLSYCSNLRYLYLSRNELQGRIPTQLGSLQRLLYLGLYGNKLTGSIPDSLGNLSLLVTFDLGSNNLGEMIPQGLGKLRQLRAFSIGYNQLSGTIPPQLYNLSNIYFFSVSTNHYIQGSLPWDIGLTLPNVEWFAVGANQLTGTIPVSLLNCSKLSYLEFNENKFSGPVPQDLGRLKNLFRLYGWSNNLGASEGNDLRFLSSLTNCTNLKAMIMEYNSLTDSLPITIWNLSSQMEIFSLRGNQIYGSIPSGISNLVSLKTFMVAQNNISGEIPDTVGKLQGLQLLELSRNKLTGRIPSFLGNLTQLLRLRLQENNLNGSIPSSLAKCQKLLVLALSNNNLTGAIPTEIFQLRSLSNLLSLSNNGSSGPLPSQVGELKHLGILDISDNKLSGSIPPTLGDCESLVRLYMEGNLFEGAIPESLSALKGIEHLDLSRNKLTGKIPEFLGNLQFLKSLNPSFNDLEGAVPNQGVFKNASSSKVDGNRKLCGGLLEFRLPLCQTMSSKKKHNAVLLKLIAPVVIMAACLALLALSLIICYKRRTSVKYPSFSPDFELKHFRISYAELAKATNSFSDANLLGIGAHGAVYKGILDHDRLIVAVKVLNLQTRGGSKSLVSECKALSNVRHRNLVKILTSCSSVDFQGNDFKALVFDFMPNGSLEKWLYPGINEECESKTFNLIQRLNIAIDVACALDYLHHHSQFIVVHCDLKPSNVFLDGQMTAHVGDYGLAKILSTISDDVGQSHTSSSAVKGSIGYVAPEYGMGSEVSTEGDVYSYGILLLEIFTGKRPTDDMFNDGLDLHRFADMSLSGKVAKIIDPRLLADEDTRGKMYECLAAVTKVGVACSKESPKDRMHMGDVVRELSSIRDFYLEASI